MRGRPHKGRLISSSVLLISAVALTGCQPPAIQLDVVRSDDQIKVSMQQNWGNLWDDFETPCVGQITLSSGSDMETIVWQVSAVPSAESYCRELDAFTIGVVPDGFEVVTPLQTTDGKLDLWVSGIGDGFAEISFRP